MSKRNNQATVWKKGALDMYGQPIWAAPAYIMVRWEEGERRYITKDGTEARGRNIIYFDGEDVLEIGDHIIRGTSLELTPPTGAWEIKQTNRIENLSGTEIEWSAVA